MSEVLGTDPGAGSMGYGTTLQGATAGAIGMINKVSIPGQDIDDIDVTTMNSPGKWKQFISGLKNPGEMRLDMLYHKTNMTVLQAALGVSQVWTVVLPDGSTFVFTGYLKNLGTEIPYQDKISQSGTFKISGAPTWHEHS